MMFTDSSDDEEQEHQELDFMEISTTKMGETSVKYTPNPSTILGTGLTAIVYPGYHFGINKPAAVKYINKKYVRIESEQVIELKIWGEIDQNQNINVIRLYDSFKEPDGGLFLAMEKAERTFRKQITKFHPDRNEVITWLNQVSKAVEYLHGKRVIHRDIKPENILMVLQDGKLVAKLGDFGGSKIISSAERSGTLSVASGTLVWMAPEAINNKSQVFKNTKMLDIFALGLVYYFALSKGGHVFKMSSRTKTTKVLSCDQVAANHLISGMLEREPSDRPNIAQVLGHCLFWNWEQEQIFLIRVAICLSISDSEEICLLKKYIDAEYLKHFWKTDGNKQFNWINFGREFELDIPILFNRTRKRKYSNWEYGDGDSVTKFLKLFRDKYVHHPEMNEDAAILFSDDAGNFCDEKYVKILTTICPNIVAVLYQILSRYRNAKCLKPLRTLYFPGKLLGRFNENSTVSNGTMYGMKKSAFRSDFKNYFAEHEQFKRRRSQQKKSLIRL